MNSSLQESYGHLLHRIRETIEGAWTWPAPEAGFAIYVAAVSENSPLLNLRPIELVLAELSLPKARAEEAPVLAAFGYLLAARPNSLSQETKSRWITGIGGLSRKEPLRADRLSFFYRPEELLGIVLGAKACGERCAREIDWLRRVLRRGKHEYQGDPAWRFCLSSLAAFTLEGSWEVKTWPDPRDLSLSELALCLWLIWEKQSFAKASGLERLQESVQRELLESAATSTPSNEPLASLAVLHESLHRLVTQMVEETIEVYHDPVRRQAASEEKKRAERHKRQVKRVEDFCRRRGRIAFWTMRLVLLPLAAGSVITYISFRVNALPQITGLEAYGSTVVYVLFVLAVFEIISKWWTSSPIKKAASWAERIWRRRWRRRLLGEEHETGSE